MREMTRESRNGLVLRVAEAGGPFWRWAWLDGDLKVIRDGVAFSRAGAEKVASAIAEIL